MPAVRAKVDGASAFAAAVCLYAVAWAGWSVTHGYGFDDDSYAILRVWQQLISQHAYVPSRFQGAPVAELPLGLAASLGGPLLSDTLAVVCTGVGLFAFTRAMTLYGVGGRALVIAAVVANGYVLIAGSTSMDYMLAFAPFSLGLWALAAGEDVAGVLLLAVAAGARIFYVALDELTLLFVLLERGRRGPASSPVHIAVCMLGCFFVSGLFYLPVWFSHGLKLDWLNAARPDEQGAAGLLARAAYKTVMFISVPGWLGAAIGWIASRRSRAPGDWVRPGGEGRTAFAGYAAAVVLLHLALFVWIPIDPSYLIPALPFGAAILAAFGRRGALVGLASGELIATLVVFDLLIVDHPARDLCARSHATGVHLRPHLAPGLLIDDARHRKLAPLCGENVLLYRPVPSTAPLPVQKPGDHGRVYPLTPPIELAPNW